MSIQPLKGLFAVFMFSEFVKLGKPHLVFSPAPKGVPEIMFYCFVLSFCATIKHRCVTPLYGIPLLSFYRSELGREDMNQGERHSFISCTEFVVIII